jgi:hypothetical protein
VPLLVVWGLAQLWSIRGDAIRLRRRGVVLTAVGSLAIIALAAVLAGPNALRMKATFGSLIGPPDLQSVQMLRDDAPAVIVNALRIGQTATDIPSARFRAKTVAESVRLLTNSVWALTIRPSPLTPSRGGLGSRMKTAQRLRLHMPWR